MASEWHCSVAETAWRHGINLEVRNRTDCCRKLLAGQMRAAPEPNVAFGGNFTPRQDSRRHDAVETRAEIGWSHSETTATSTAALSTHRRPQSLTDGQGAADGDQDHHQLTPCRTCITGEKNC